MLPIELLSILRGHAIENRRDVHRRGWRRSSGDPAGSERDTSSRRCCHTRFIGSPLIRVGRRLCIRSGVKILFMMFLKSHIRVLLVSGDLCKTPAAIQSAS